MNRQEAFQLLTQKLKNKNLIKHSLAVESAMSGLAQFFQVDNELWGLCGLLHDIDYELIGESMELHSKKGAEILEEMGFEKELCQAVLTHNSAHGIKPKTLMAKALFCVDSLSGLIVAATLVLPSRKIKDLKTENVLNRFQDKSFAAGASRKNIKKCEEYLNLPLERFVEIVLSSMQNIADNLNL